MLRKGLVKNMTTMILILMTGGVVAATLGGPLYGAMEEGYNEIQQFLGIADRTQLSDGEEYSARDKLAAIAHYSWDRAHSCEYVNRTIAGGGYKPLQETSYGEEPPCSGQGGTFVADFLTNILDNSGNDMEGKYSRIEFEVKDRIVLDTSKFYGYHEDGWESNSYTVTGVACSQSEQQSQAAGCGETVESSEKSFRPWAISRNGEEYNERVAKECGKPSSMGEISYYSWPIVFAVPQKGIEDSRTNFYNSFDWDAARDKAASMNGLGANKPNTQPLCGKGVVGGIGDRKGYLTHHRMVQYWNGDKGRTEIVLCPGDKGYLQVNKGAPAKEDEYTGGTEAGGHFFPYIQVNEVNESGECSSKSPTIPDDANSSGSDLELSANRNSNSIEIDDFRLEKEGLEACRVSLTEKDRTKYTSENGYVEYRAGTILPRKGKFPQTGSDSVINSNLQEKNGLFQDYGTRGLYDFFSKIAGLDGRAVESDNAPLLNSIGGKRLEMYGDLLCVQNQNDYQQPQWVACDESVSDLNSSADRELTVRTSDQGFPLNFRCNMQTGEWQLHSTGRTCESVRQNGPPSEKIDVVFYGGQFDSVENLRSNASYLVDWNGDNQGLMSVEPFASNRDRFNFWAVNSTDPIPLDSSNPGAFDRRNALLTPRLACGADRTDEIVVLSRREGRSYAFSPTNATAGGSWDREAYVYIGNEVETESVQLSELFRSSEDMERRLGVTPEELDISLEDTTIRLDNDSQNDPRTFVHEFGHSFGGLQDEYTEFGARDDPGRPNCADDRQQAEDWWGELAGEEDSVDYFEGCSYVNSNVRPTIMSLMYIQFFDSYDFELVNEGRLERVIENYDTGDES